MRGLFETALDRVGSLIDFLLTQLLPVYQTTHSLSATELLPSVITAHYWSLMSDSGHESWIPNSDIHCYVEGLFNPTVSKKPLQPLFPSSSSLNQADVEVRSAFGLSEL